MGLEFIDFLNMLASDDGLRHDIDNVFRACSDNDCGECIRSTLEYYYYKYLFTRKIDKNIARDLKKCIEKA